MKIIRAVMFESDVSIYCYGPNTVSAISDVLNYKEDATYLKYIEANKTQVENVPKREWAMSRFDTSYSK